jgi:hypothetical protein
VRNYTPKRAGPNIPKTIEKLRSELLKQVRKQWPDRPALSGNAGALAFACLGSLGVPLPAALLSESLEQFQCALLEQFGPLAVLADTVARLAIYVEREEALGSIQASVEAADGARKALENLGRAARSLRAEVPLPESINHEFHAIPSQAAQVESAAAVMLRALSTFSDPLERRRGQWAEPKHRRDAHFVRRARELLFAVMKDGELADLVDDGLGGTPRSRVDRVRKHRQSVAGRSSVGNRGGKPAK